MISSTSGPALAEAWTTSSGFARQSGGCSKNADPSARGQKRFGPTMAVVPTLGAIATKVRGRTRPSVLCVVDRLPGTLRDVYVATEGSYLVELVRIAGGDPITPPATHNYVHISVEAIVASDPEVVLDVVQAIAEPVNVLGSRALSGEPLDAWRQTPTLRAVKNERVYHFVDTRLVHPSQFSAEAALEMAKRLHPDAFP